VSALNRHRLPRLFLLSTRCGAASSLFVVSNSLRLRRFASAREKGVKMSPSTDDGIYHDAHKRKSSEASSASP
jgi:hypothetical protein